MASPIGHALVGATIARRLGVRSPAGMAAAVAASGAPDLDVVASMLLHGNTWRLHKAPGGTHTMGFALTAGMLAGFAGLVSAGSADGERDLVADALTGAAVVGSHIVLDRLPLPYLKWGKTAKPREWLPKAAWNWGLDAIVYTCIARALWPRSDAQKSPA